MTKRYYQRDYEELYYIIDSHTISEKEFDEKAEYDGYTAFEDSMTGEEIVDLLNENEKLKSDNINQENLITVLRSEIKDFQELLASREEVFLKPILTMIDENINIAKTHYSNEKSNTSYYQGQIEILNELRKKIIN